MKTIKRFLREETGLTAAEYGILLGLMTALLVGGMLYFFNEMGGLFSGWGGYFSLHKPT
jgi:Flp pilus assembly pilin Flp